MNSKQKIVFLPHGNLQYSQLRPEKRGWVIAHCYEQLFDLVACQQHRIGFEASGFTVNAIAELNPSVMDKLKGLIHDELIEPVASPYIHIMPANIDPRVGLESLKKGLDTWEKHTGIRPKVGWNPECGWADYIPEIYKEAGFETLIMDGDSYFLSFEDVRQATGLAFDVKGHSNKGKLFRIETYIKDKPDYLKYLTNPSVADNGLKMLFRSDMMANPMLWYLMGATEGVREQPVTLDEIRHMLSAWKERIAQTGHFIMPFAEDAEYIGSSAYFYVKQFGQARFFEPEPDSVTRFGQLLETAVELGYEPTTPSAVLETSESCIDNEHIHAIENGIAWHGGTAKAWANTAHARILDPVCGMLLEGIKAIAQYLNIPLAKIDGPLRIALENLTSAYVSDARWPPAPTSPGRFNVKESIADLFAANDALDIAMRKHGLEARRSLYSPGLMKTQIEAAYEELMNRTYFGE